MIRRAWFGAAAIRRAWFGAAGALLLAITLLFLVLPVVAIFTHTTPARLIGRLGDPVSRDALWLSLRTSALAMLITILAGTPAAYLLARGRFRGRALALTVIELPLVLPPAVAGIGLLASLGPQGVLGGLHLPLVFQTAGVVVALTFVAAPLFIRQAQASFAAVPGELLDAARTLGAGPAETFTRVAVPVAAPGLAAGMALAWARALGEFGATLMFAGSLQAVTQTTPLAIYDQFASDLPAALALSAVLVLVSASILFAVKLLPWPAAGALR